MSSGGSKPLVWMSGEVKTPPFSAIARGRAGALLRQIQDGVNLAMPHSRPMPSLGPRCHELRIRDGAIAWRIAYRIDPDAIPIVAVFPKATAKTPRPILEECRKRLGQYDRR